MRRTLFIGAVLVVLVALLAACGGGSGGSSSTQPTASATAMTSATTTTGGAASATTTTGGGASATTTTSGGAAGGATGDPKAGETLFTSATIGANPGCKTCHTIDGTKLVGPSLQGIGTRAATRVPGQSAEEYIKTSILDPNAFVVEGFASGVMPSFKPVLSDQQLNDLVAYLMTLK